MDQLSLVSTESQKALTFGASTEEAPALKASVERVIYFHEDTGQCMLEVKPEHLTQNILISGRLPYVYPGQIVSAQRIFQSDSEHSTLHTESMSLSFPSTVRLVKKFLKSDAIPSIKPKVAVILAEAFPTDLFQILDNAPEKLLKVKGIGKKSLSVIIDSWKEYKSVREFESFLFAQKLPLIWSKSIWPIHRFESLQYFKEHPYKVAQQHKLPFEIIDSFALRMGFAFDSHERISCGLQDTLDNHCKQGHCAYPETKLLDETSEKIGVSLDLVENAYELELIEEKFVSDEIEGIPCIYLKEIWELEKNVAAQLLEFQNRPPPWGYVNLPKVLPWAQSLLNIQLAPLQVYAIETALSSALTVITGGPGTGKTTLIRSLVTILQTQFTSFALCSPTGRAAQRLSEATGAPAQTIHRLLKFNSLTGEFQYNRHRPLEIDLLLVDEASMVDLPLMSHLLDALPKHCALILVGDADQIPSVGFGSVLQSVIASDKFITVKLTDIFRQHEKSLIRLNANRINQGLMPVETPNAQQDFHYIPVHGVEKTKQVIMDLVTRVIPEKCGIIDPSQIQILVPMNKGPLGTQELNEDLQKYSPVKTGRPSENLSGFGQTYKVGDKVMVIKNDYKKDVFNGDIGFIHHIDHQGQYLEIHFDDRNIHFGFDELDKLTLAYAISIHKSQGSEYRAVIVVISNKHIPMVQRNLIYTAVTRGKEHVFLVAEPNALQTAVLSDENNRRWQKLTELLMD